MNLSETLANLERLITGCGGDPGKSPDLNEIQEQMAQT